jgi:hypothetical protein
MFKDIPGFEGLYKIDQFGLVMSYDKWVPMSYGRVRFINSRVMKQKNDKNGYKKITLSKDGKDYQHMVHRLVAITYIENPGNKKTVNHKNAIKYDNRIENLEWNTSKEQTTHAYANNLIKPPHSKIVLDLNSGIFYDGSYKAAFAKNLNPKSIRSYLTNRRPNKTGLIYV